MTAKIYADHHIDPYALKEYAKPQVNAVKSSSLPNNYTMSHLWATTFSSPPMSREYASSRIEQIANRVSGNEYNLNYLEVDLPRLVENGRAIVDAALKYDPAVNRDLKPLYPKEISADLSTVVENFAKVDAVATKAMASFPKIQNTLEELRRLSDTMREAIIRLATTAAPSDLSIEEREPILPLSRNMQMQVKGLKTPEKENPSISARTLEKARHLISWRAAREESATVGVSHDFPVYLFGMNLMTLSMDAQGVVCASECREFNSFADAGPPLDSKGKAMSVQDVHKEVSIVIDALEKVKVAAQELKAAYAHLPAGSFSRLNKELDFLEPLLQRLIATRERTRYSPLFFHPQSLK